MSVGPGVRGEQVIRGLAGQSAELDLKLRRIAALAASGLSLREEVMWSLSLEGKGRLEGLGWAPTEEQLTRLVSTAHPARGRPASPPSSSPPVVLAPQAAGVLLHEVVGHLCEDPGQDPGSLLEDLWGRRLVRAPLGYVDDPTRPGLAASYAVDDEGSPARAVRVMDRGRLKGLLSTP